jgi:hypothetical protein
MSPPTSLLHGLLVAVALCWLLWPAPADAQPACAHDICEFGGNLNPVCDPCVDAICNNAVTGDPYCCAVEWDDNCVDQVLSVCGDPSCLQVCSHNPCEVGEALDSTCNSCTAEICFQHPECCTDDGDPLTDDWDANCVDKVEQICDYQCDPGADACFNALPIQPGTTLGTLIGASNDGCASGDEPTGPTVSCRSADVWYSYTQGPAANMTVSTCTTQRSFGIDSVVSVHTGCPGKRNNEIIANDDWLLGPAPLACQFIPAPFNLDAAVPLGGVYAIPPGQTVVIRVAHHDDSVRDNFQLQILPEPQAWLALVAGAGALSALSRRRARG